MAPSCLSGAVADFSLVWFPSFEVTAASVGCREVDNGSDGSETEAGVVVADETAAAVAAGVGLALDVDEGAGGRAGTGTEAGAR